jgi:hypothetical protein
MSGDIFRRWCAAGLALSDVQLELLVLLSETLAEPTGFGPVSTGYGFRLTRARREITDYGHGGRARRRRKRR